MDHRDVFQRLFDPFVRGKRSPALGIFGPRITCKQDTTTGLLAIIRVEHVANGKIGDSPAAVDTSSISQKLLRVWKNIFAEAS